MDVETSVAIETLRGDLRKVESSLSARIDASEARLRAEMRSEMGGLREELKRHTDVKFESVRDDIRMVAEDLAVLTQKVESLGDRFGR